MYYDFILSYCWSHHEKKFHQKHKKCRFEAKMQKSIIKWGSASMKNEGKIISLTKSKGRTKKKMWPINNRARYSIQHRAYTQYEKILTLAYTFFLSFSDLTLWRAFLAFLTFPCFLLLDISFICIIFVVFGHIFAYMYA